jgi:hypothetical protein
MAPPFFPDYHGFGVKMRYRFQGITMEPEDKLVLEGPNTPVDNDHQMPQRCELPLFGAEYGKF